MLAYDYPMLDVFVSMLGLILFVIWLYLLVEVITDLFADHEQSSAGKALWVLIIFVLPYIGVITYIAVHGQQMSLRPRAFDRRRGSFIR
jgi:divalent metal cation (Fe/Co/Zn/Cd) transporter